MSWRKFYRITQKKLIPSPETQCTLELLAVVCICCCLLFNWLVLDTLKLYIISFIKSLINTIYIVGRLFTKTNSRLKHSFLAVMRNFLLLLLYNHFQLKTILFVILFYALVCTLLCINIVIFHLCEQIFTFLAIENELNKKWAVCLLPRTASFYQLKLAEMFKCVKLIFANFISHSKLIWSFQLYGSIFVRRNYKQQQIKYFAFYAGKWSK